MNTFSLILLATLASACCHQSSSRVARTLRVENLESARDVLARHGYTLLEQEVHLDDGTERCEPGSFCEGRYVTDPGTAVFAALRADGQHVVVEAHFDLETVDVRRCGCDSTTYGGAEPPPQYRYLEVDPAQQWEVERLEEVVPWREVNNRYRGGSCYGDMEVP